MIYSLVYNWNYSQILVTCNKCIIMYLIDDDTDDEEYEKINQYIVYGICI